MCRYPIIISNHCILKQEAISKDSNIENPIFCNCKTFGPCCNKYILLDHPRLWAALCSWPWWVTCQTPTYCRPQRVGGARRTSSSRGVRLTGSTTTATTRDISINISNLQSYEDWIIFTENGFTFILVLVILDRVWYKRPRCLSDVNCVPHTNHHHNFRQIPATRDTKLTWRTNWLLKILSHLKCKVFYIKFIFWFI